MKYFSLLYQYLVNRVTTGEFVPKVCNVIYHCLKDKYPNIPSTSGEWDGIRGNQQHSFFHSSAFIAADGKRIALFYQSGSGSEF